MSALAMNPEVVCTELEDGAVLLNMQTRLYYSLNEVGLELWNLVDVARTPEQVGDALAASFGIEEGAARDAASRFLAALEREQLVVAAGDGETAAGGSPPAPAPAGEGGSQRRFVEPDLVKHDEPLHEVSASPFDPQLPLAE